MESHLNLLTSDRLIQGVPDTIEERHCMGKGTPHWLEQFPTMLRRNSKERAIIKLPDASLECPSMLLLQLCNQPQILLAKLDPLMDDG